jgi:hypothetical protein
VFGLGLWGFCGGGVVVVWVVCFVVFGWGWGCLGLGWFCGGGVVGVVLWLCGLLGLVFVVGWGGCWWGLVLLGSLIVE